MLSAGAPVAVVGAGAAGLVAIRVLREAGFRVVCFEASNEVGGTWVYADVNKVPDWAGHDVALRNEPGGDDRRGSPSPSHSSPLHSSMYQSLRTNLPKQVMLFPGMPFPDAAPSFPGHVEVQRYLLRYAERHAVRDHIRFETPVQEVRPVSSRALDGYVVRYACRQRPDEVREEWYAAVCVCNGHYTVPYVPSHDSRSVHQVDDESKEDAGRGIVEHLTDGTFAPGRIHHSHFYRQPTRYAQQRVLCLGAGPSGIDISLDVARVAARPVYLSFHGSMPAACVSALRRAGVQPVAALTAVTGPRQVRLADGTQLDDLDVILLCTGYRYAFPFLADACEVRVQHGGRVVTPLYRHLLPVHRPNLPLVGLPYSVVPFPLFEYQMRYVCRVLSGAIRLPSESAMRQDTREEWRARTALGMAPRHFHRLGDRQWAYDRYLADAAGVKGPTLAAQSVYNDAGTSRKANPVLYREREYRIFGDGPEDWEVAITVAETYGAERGDARERDDGNAADYSSVL
ncbi:hypothetical protein CDCA_CDCA13G3614 [Cyanidium caldarium]|uniref:Flavin-containing monooxygenase n=1 Tax=Cyanidium caldarium TaxID=2771 RepID=A0AAV9IZT5_CYACA|nr:hypothetical protein CDCA_CDCA13G3614 [Cyanidium caldarium]